MFLRSGNFMLPSNKKSTLKIITIIYNKRVVARTFDANTIVWLRIAKITALLKLLFVAMTLLYVCSFVVKVNSRADSSIARDWSVLICQ